MTKPAGRPFSNKKISETFLHFAEPNGPHPLEHRAKGVKTKGADYCQRSPEGSRIHIE
jgi:hypothetical protein